MKRNLCISLLLAVSFAVTAAASSPTLVNYQGKLTDDGGNPVNDTLAMIFTIYDDAVAGNIKWQEGHLSVPIVNGLFTVLLGDGGPTVALEDSVFSQPDRWLGVAVGGDPEMTPRTRLSTQPYTHRVTAVDGAAGGTLSSDLSVVGNMAAVDGSLSGDLSVTGTVDATGMSSKIRFHFLNFGDLPDATTYHGMLAHVHNDAKVYYAHAGSWVPLANESALGGSAGWNDDGTAVRLTTVSDSVGIGKALPTSKVDIETNVTSASLAYGLRSVTTNTGTGGGVGGYFEDAFGTGASYGVVAVSNTNTALDSAFGMYSIAGNASGGPAIGGFYYAGNSGTGDKVGVLAHGENNEATTAYGVLGRGDNIGSGPAVGGWFETTDAGNGSKTGVVGTGDGTSGLVHTGVRGVALNDGTGSSVGGSFEAFINGSGGKIGVEGLAFAQGTSSATIYSGTASSTSGNVFGADVGVIANGTGNAYGVDITTSTLGGTSYGVDITSTSGGGAYGVRSTTTATGGGVVYGHRSTANANTNGAFGMYAEANSTSNFAYGVTGIASSATSSTNRGMYASSTNNGTGGAWGIYATSDVNGNGQSYAGNFIADAASNATSRGVSATADNTGSGGAYAVYGSADGNTGFGYGGRFLANASGVSSARGVFASATNTGTGPAYGLYASASASGTGTHYGVYGVEASGGTGAAVYASGDTIASGAKPAVVRTSKGPTLLYAMESPEIWFEDFGTGQLSGGTAHIEMDELFLETVTLSNDHPIRVFIQLNDDCNGTYVKATGTGFDVHELQGGSSNAAFSYRVVAKRKGFERERMEQTDVGYWDVNLYPERADEIREYHERMARVDVAEASE